MLEESQLFDPQGAGAPFTMSASEVFELLVYHGYSTSDQAELETFKIAITLFDNEPWESLWTGRVVKRVSPSWEPVVIAGAVCQPHRAGPRPCRPPPPPDGDDNDGDFALLPERAQLRGRMHRAATAHALLDLADVPSDTDGGEPNDEESVAP